MKWNSECSLFHLVSIVRNYHLHLSFIMKKLNYIFILLLFLNPFYGFAEDGWTKIAENILNDKTITDSYERWEVAFDTVSIHIQDIPFEEALMIYQKILLPYIDKEVKNSALQHRGKSLIYNDISWIYYTMGEFEDMVNCEFFLKKGVEHAELSNHIETQALLYRCYGKTVSTMGNVSLAHQYLYMAINLYELLERYGDVASCLFSIAENMSQIRDTAGMKRVVELLEQNIEKQFSEINNYSLYAFYAVQATYYGIMSEDHPENSSYVQLSFETYRKLIHLLENDEQLQEIAGLSFPYYNFALHYRANHPEQYDSIRHYLNKALESAHLEGFLDPVYEIEVEISVYILSAELHFAQNNLQQAEKEMLYVLSLLEKIPDFNSVVADYSEVYKFMVIYYETINLPEKALEYQKLLTANEKRRYENEKIVAMNDMLTKHEVEKKNEQIERLHEQEQTSRKILTLTICLLVVVLIALLILFRFYKLRKKSLEQSIYESVLLSELKQNELEQQLTEKELLQQQYEELKLRAERHEVTIQSFNDEIKYIKGQLEQKPTRTIVEKLGKLIMKSNIKKSEKERYINQLAELDIEMMEQGFLTADEKISNMDMKYLVCFAIDMDTTDISQLFNIAPTSIYTVRYRIRKKFGKTNTFKFLI